MGGFLDFVKKISPIKIDTSLSAGEIFTKVGGITSGASTPEIYPKDLFTPGNEPYILFYVRDSVKLGNIKNRVALYMPPTLRVNYGVGYTPIELSLLQYQDVAKDSGAAIKELYGAQGNLERIAGILAKNRDYIIAGGANVVDSVASDLNIRQQAEVLTKTTINPHMAMVFEGVQFRTFTFSFQMMARNQKESVSIRNIIQTFKMAMHPSKKGTEHFWTYPDNFEIQLFSPSQEFLFAMSTCVLTDMAVDYAGSGIPSFFTATGAPVDIRMDLTFTEIEVMTKERIEYGY